MDKNFVKNQCLVAPGLALSGSASLTVKYANTFTFRADGFQSPSITTANAPSLVTAPTATPNLANAGTLAAGFNRTYALIGTLASVGGNATTGAPVFTWYAGSDIANGSSVQASYFNVEPNLGLLDCVIGWVNVRNDATSTSSFTPGTTRLDAASTTATYLDNFGLSGR